MQHSHLSQTCTQTGQLSQCILLRKQLLTEPHVKLRLVASIPEASQPPEAVAAEGRPTADGEAQDTRKGMAEAELDPGTRAQCVIISPTVDMTLQADPQM